MTVQRIRGRSVAMAAGFASLAVMGTAFLATAGAQTPAPGTPTVVIPSTAVVVPGDDGARTETVPGSPHPVRIRPVYTC
jgi:hypothetical protein